MRRRERMRLNAVTAGCVGVVGFLVLLVAGSFAGPWATPLRLAAIVWLLLFGLLKLGLDLLTRR